MLLILCHLSNFLLLYAFFFASNPRPAVYPTFYHTSRRVPVLTKSNNLPTTPSGPSSLTQVPIFLKKKIKRLKKKPQRCIPSINLIHSNQITMVTWPGSVAPARTYTASPPANTLLSPLLIVRHIYKQWPLCQSD